jgi:Concanavalin A-like lectin/glucanases superfamily/Domain of unknown function (DUF2341)
MPKIVKKFIRYCRGVARNVSSMKRVAFNKRQLYYVSTIFGIAIIIVVGIIYIFNKPAAVEAEWWSDGWMYRSSYPISYSQSGLELTEYQVLIDGLDTATLVTAGKMQSDCDDIRFTSIQGIVLDYSIVGKTCNTSDTKIWVKVDSIVAGGTTLFLYYGNQSADSYHSESKTFSYSSEKLVAYVLNDSVADLQVISLSENNSISHNSNTLSLGKYGVGSFASISQWGEITAKGLFNADDDSSNTDLVVPISWAGTEFYLTSRDDGVDKYSMIAPWDDATVTIYENGAVAPCSPATVTSAGIDKTCTWSSTYSRVRLSSTVPILVFMEASVDSDYMPVHPITTQKWIGSGSATRLTNGATLLNYGYYYDTSASDNTGTAGVNAYLDLDGESGYGVGALLVRSTNAVYDFSIMQFGDGDGSDGHFYNDITEQGTVFGAANQADYISVASTQDSTCTVYEIDGTQLASSIATSSNTEIYFKGFGTGNSSTYTTSDWYMECDKPVVAHYQKASAYESNLMSWPMMRQFSYPTPSVGSSASEEKGPGPVAYWSFDEGVDNTCTGGSNDICDATSSGHDGVRSGATWQSEDMCISGSCLKFDGSNDTVNVGIGSDYFPMETFSMCSWIRTPGLGAGMSQPGILAFTYGLRFDLTSAGVFYTGIYNGSTSVWRSAGDSLFDNKWHHLCLTYDGVDRHMYIDGANKLSSATTWPGSCFTTNDVNIGRDNNNSNYYFNGFIDEPKLYNYARTDVQIKADYLAGQSGSPSGVSASFGGGQQQSESEGLVGYWDMDEVSGNILDSSGNGNTGTVTGTTVVAGKYGNGRSFNGSSYADMGDKDLITNRATWSAWIYMNDLSTNAIMTKWENAGNQEFWFGQYSADSDEIHLAFEEGFDAYTGTYSSGANLQAGQWYYLVATYDGDLVKFYKNGQYISTTDVYNGSIANGSANLLIGAQNDGAAATINGKLDDVKIYNVARTADQIMRDYKQGPGPIAYYNFEEGSGATVFDRSGNGNNGAITDATYALGRSGWAGNFDGNDYVQGTLNGLGGGAVPHTITMWLYANSLSASRADPITIGNAVAGQYSSLDLYSTYTNWYFYSNDVNYTAITAGQWVHVAAVYDGSDYGTSASKKLYYDGIEQSVVADNSDAGDAFNMPSNPTFGIGRDWDRAMAYFPGKIDEVKVYNYARTQEQILWDMHGDESPHPVAYWNFNEGADNTCSGGTNDVCDVSGNGVDGTIIGANWTNNGKIGNALSFDSASGDYVNIPSASTSIENVTDDGNSFSFSVWFKQNNLPQNTNDGLIIVRPGYHMGIFHAKSDGIIRAIVWYSDNTATGKAGPTLTNGVWYHVVMTVDEVNNKFRFYVDGEEMGSASTLTKALKDYGTGAYRIGNGSTAYSADGVVDEVKIFNFPLSPEQVRQEYNQGNQVSLGQQKDSSETWNAGGFGGDAPIAYWDFEEGSGSTVYDKSSNSNDGTITNATYTLGNPGWGLNFDATDFVNSGTSVSDFESAGTVMMWLYMNNKGGLFSRSTGGGWLDERYVIHFYNSSGNEPRLTLSSGSSFETHISDQPLDVGVWTHIAITHDGSNVKWYHDGRLADTDIQTIVPEMTGVKTYIGQIEGLVPNDFDGKIDEVKIFNYARTPAQIAFDYNGGKPVGWWSLNDGEGIYANDSSGNNNDGTLITMDPATDWLDGVDCKFEGCLEFDGSDDDISIPHGSSVDITGNEITIAYWQYWIDAGDHDHPIVSKNTNSTWNPGTGYVIGMGWGSTYYFGVGNNTAANITIDSQQSVWQHIVMTYKNGVGVKIYVDGVEKYSNAGWSGAIGSNSHDLWIGDAVRAGQYKGRLDDIRIYNYALTADQLKEVYNQGLIHFK